MTAKARGRPVAPTSEPAWNADQGSATYSTMTERASRQRADKAVFARIFVSDFLAETSGMKPADVGIFIRLIVLMHQRGEPLPHDRNRLAKMCFTTPAAFDAAVELLVDERLIKRAPDGLWADSVGREIQNREEISQKNRQNATKGRGKTQQNQAPKRAVVEPSRVQSPDSSSGPPPADPSSPRRRQTRSAGDAPLARASRYSVGQDIVSEAFGLCTVVEILNWCVRVHDCNRDVHEIPTKEDGTILDGAERDEIPF